jgi:hypothetical protein
MRAGITCLAVIIGFAAIAATPEAHAADAVSYGAPIIEKSIKIEDLAHRGARFVSPRNYAETVKFYKKLWKGVETIEFRRIATPPQVRALHIENSNPRAAWAWMNIYENKGETRIFIFPRKGSAE